MANASPITTDRPPSEAQFEVLVVEDNPAHVRLLQEALKEVKSGLSVHSVQDGEAALDELQTRLDDVTALPDLVLVDLHLPGMDGTGVIDAIRTDPRLECLPVIVLTSSDASEDVTRCYESGANAYLTKPNQLDELVSLVEMIEAFWFGAARLPRGSP